MENYIKDKNKYFIFNEKLKSSELYIKYKFTKYFCRTIGPVICSECSGINKNGSNVYKIINSIEEFKLHCGVYHNKYIPVNSICKFNIPKDYIIIERNKGECFLLKKIYYQKVVKHLGNITWTPIII